MRAPVRLGWRVVFLSSKQCFNSSLSLCQQYVFTVPSIFHRLTKGRRFKRRPIHKDRPGRAAHHIITTRLLLFPADAYAVMSLAARKEIFSFSFSFGRPCVIKTSRPWHSSIRVVMFVCSFLFPPAKKEKKVHARRYIWSEYRGRPLSAKMYARWTLNSQPRWSLRNDVTHSRPLLSVAG